METFVKFTLANQDKDIYINPEYIACIHSHSDIVTTITFCTAEHDSMCVRGIKGSLEDVKVRLAKAGHKFID